MERNKKRKREVDNPRITYHALTRTFDRLFKEESLAEMKEAARRKLGISLGTPIRLAQIRDGKFIDLDDDDDFDALYAVAHSTSLVNVQVTVGPEATMPESDNPPKKQKRKEIKSAVVQPDNGTPELEARGQLVQTEMLSTNRQADPGTGDTSILESVSVPPKKRRKKKASNTADTNEAYPQGTPTTSSAEILVPEIIQLSTIGPKKDVVTTEQEKGASGSKNARRRKQKLSQLQPPQVRRGEMDPGAQEIMINERTREYPMGESPEVREVPFAEQLVGAISESNVINQRHSGASSVTDKARSGIREKHKTNPRVAVISTASVKGKLHRKNRFISDVDESEQQEVRITTDSNKPNGAAIRKSKAQGKASKTDELEAANADVKATALRILASKRALLAEEIASNVRGTQQPPRAPDGPESGDIHCGHPLDSLSQRKAFDDGSPRVVAAIAGNTSIPELSVPPPLAEPRSAALEYVPPPILNSMATQHSSSDSESTSDASGISLSHDAPDIHKSMVTPTILESTYTNVDLEALIRGPKIPLIVADITSPNFSDEEEQEEHLELEEDTQEEHSNRRSALQDRDSSEEETGDEVDDGDPSMRTIIEEKQLPSAMETQPTSPQGNSNPVTPYWVIDSPGPSLGVEGFGHTSFEGDSDTVFEMTKEEATRSSDVIHNPGVKHLTGNSTNTPPITQALPDELLPTQLITTGSGLTGSAEFSKKLPNILPSIEIKTPDTPRRNGVIQRMRGRDGKIGQGKIDSTTPLKFQRSGEPGTQRAIAKRTRSNTSSRLIQPLQVREGDASHNNHSFASVPPANGKVQQTTIAGAPTLPLASPIGTSAKELSEAQSSVQKSIPLDTWVTLKLSSPLLDADSTTMIDELESSSSVKGSPLFSRHSSPKEPLFILTESQAPFPYSQWTGMAPKEDLEVVSNDSDDEEMMDVPIRTRSQISNISKYNTYRKLTDITSQQTLFTTPPMLQSTLPRSTKHRLADLYGPRSQKEGNESESDPDPDSDSDVSVSQEKSHIPEGRRAGVVQKRKK
ncbi:hypothetical protein BDZ94DRAFT_1317052 [Collybia nuda]|uniref:Uncharacterized protein n=1 Tax=Collybia nuda TaxID=64659 RepID=A0A9P5YJA0_9AGAR|nr:hypothetical protein BDZ94DRAFT_1317052 [Collybia nuda]